MKLRTVERNLKNGTTRLVKKFAWLPMEINGTLIWLERYEILKAYIGTTYKVIVDDKPVSFIVYKWISISKRMI